MDQYIDWGKQIYNLGNSGERRRFIVFLVRCHLHSSDIERLYNFFYADPLRKRIIEVNKFPLEQATRAFFYAGADLSDRIRLIENHFTILQEKLTPDVFLGLYKEKPYMIWKSKDEDIDWYAQLHFHGGQRKEGLLALEMKLGTDDLYQVMFWLNKNKNGESSMYIGALQGPNMENARDVVKDMTKRAHRYRTKNLAIHMTMAVTRALGMEHIYAVTNEGYYAMNHVRKDRKLKTDFGEFWQELGGTSAEDKRFYELPLYEPRKTMEEIPARKRADYRRRFAFLDEVDEEIEMKMKALMTAGGKE